MHTRRLSAELSQLQERTGEAGYRLDELLNAFGDRGFGVFLTILAVPSALPVPAPGYSTPFGILLALLGVQMVFQRPRPWLPRRARSFRISAATGRRMAASLTRIFAKLETLIKPRCLWMESKLCSSAIGALVVLMGLLMCFPIPLTNTAPALIILLTGIGLIEKDGLITSGALVLGLLLALFYAASMVAVFYFGLQGMEEVKEIIKGRLH